MPRGDGTGPLGMGPLTGRAAGYCAGYPVPGFANPIPGYGLGLGLGYGRGRGFFRPRGGMYRRAWYGAAYARPYAAPYGVPVSPLSAGNPEVSLSEEKAYLLEAQKNLEAHLEYLGGQLEEVKSHLQELEKRREEKETE